jgi:hypothetical protein
VANPYETGLSLGGSRIVGNPYTLQMGLTQEELTRVSEELVYWKFYKGNQWNYKRPEGEPQNTINYSARFVDKGVAFLMGKGFTINVEKEAEGITKPYLDKVWDDNNRLALGVEMGQSGGITGNAFVKVALEQYDKNEDPLLYEFYPKGRIRLTVLPSYSVFPRWNAHDKDRMDDCKIIYPIEIVDDKGRVETKWYREEITKKTIKEYLDDKLVNTRKNDLGAIYVVRIRNLIVANHSLGKSDLQDIIPLQKEFNEKTTDVSDIINYHASPITVVYGAKTNNLEKGARKIWGGLPKDAKVENLELKTDLSSSMNYIELVKNAMFEVASMPEDALGAKTAVSNTSGIALHIKNQPLIDTNNNKRITYSTGIEEINRLILRYADVYELEDFDKAGFNKLKPVEKWSTDIVFPDPLPKDELIQMQIIAQKLTNHLITRLDALKELGEYDAVTKLEEIKKEFVEWQNLMFEAMPQVDPVTGQPKAPKQPNIGGVNRDKADLTGQSGRNHSKKKTEGKE